jgi:hypothetical protein
MMSKFNEGIFPVATSNSARRGASVWSGTVSFKGCGEGSSEEGAFSTISDG